jgi:putative flippase GtrA
MSSLRFPLFFLVSGVGWVLDVIFSTTLVQVGLSPFTASMIGAAAAVTFVYVMSRLSIFAQKTVGTWGEYLLYIVWQVIAISAASLFVATLAVWIEPKVAVFASSVSERLDLAFPNALALAMGVGKVLVTPLTLTANFLFMRWLTERRERVKSDRTTGEWV